MYQYHTLSNKVRIVFRQTASDVLYSGVYIGVGSRDEQGPEEGIAHFIEHSIFKGTEHRRSYHILNRIDGVGGELNAFTTKEETCIYATSLSEHLERCLELFSDILFHSTFPEKELQKEKDVVLEEINSYKDAPADQIYDDFEEYILLGHPLSHNILGTPKNVRHFSPDVIREFMRRNYTTDRMVITVVGNVKFDKLVRLCEKYFQQYPLTPSTLVRNNPPRYRHFETHLNRRTHQVHMLLGCRAPHCYDEKKVPFTLLNNILGGPAMNSRLNVAIREKYGFCYTIESQYVPFTDAGLFYIYAGVDGDAWQRATQLVREELDKCCQSPLHPRQLKAAQQQLVGQMAINNDSGLNEMQSIGKACLNYDHVDTLEEMNHDIYSVTPEDILTVAQELFQPENLSVLYYK